MHAQRALAVATISSSSIGDQLQHLNLQVTADASYFPSQHTKHDLCTLSISIHEVDVHLCICTHVYMYITCVHSLQNKYLLYMQLSS